ncbi:hypothetical protein GW17_00032652 [Ensete ventricosum]|nr:hypothetical protein GW17_00032652 [Ensete ventricosum]
MGDSGLIGYNFSHHLLFSSLPLRKNCEIRLEEFRYRDPLWRLRTARPQGATTSGQPARANRQRPTRKGQWPARKRRPTAHPQGATARRGGGAGRRGGRPLAWRLSVATRSVAAYAGAATTQEGEGEEG